MKTAPWPDVKSRDPASAATIEPHGVHQLTCEIVVPRPIGDVFPFFADAFNLERITPPWLRFRVLTPPPIEMRPGAQIDYKLRLHGIPLRWRSEIIDWEPPHRFVDRQLRGPYKLWIHEHRFEECEQGTRMRDHVQYAVPGGAWLGGLVHKLYVGPSVRGIFEYRSRILGEIFDMDASSMAGRIEQR